MNAKEYITPELEAEVKHSLDRLLASAGKNRQQAASELSRLGIWTRSSAQTRGSLRTSAKNRLPQPGKLRELLRCLDDDDKHVRCQVALALGEWGGEDAAAALYHLLQSDADEE